MKSWANRYRADNIGRNEELRPQQDGLTEIAAKSPVTIIQSTFLDNPPDKDDSGDDGAQHDNADGNGFDAYGDLFDGLIEAFKTPAGAHHY